MVAVDFVQLSTGAVCMQPRLVAVSKLKSLAHIRAAYDAGQRVSAALAAWWRRAERERVCVCV